jgi:hypothetical protein
MSSLENTDLVADAKRLAEEIGRRLDRGEGEILDLESLQQLMGSLCRLYSLSVENGEVEPPVATRTGIGATDAMVVSNGLLRAAGMSAFELGFWQNWTGR